MAEPAPLLDAVRVVLAGPMFGGNVGAAARAVANTGLGGLALVDPSYEDHDEARMFSHGAEDILDAASRHEGLAAAVEGRQRVVGFTVRQRNRRHMQPLRPFAAGWVQEALDAGGAPPTALVFGRERDGLSNDELDLCTDLVWIPSHPRHPSYNLAQAVLLAGHELFVAALERDPGQPASRPRSTRQPPPSQLATAEELEQMYSHLRAAFLALGYAQEHTADHMVRSWQGLLERARVYRREAAMLRGLARQAMYVARRAAGRDGD